MCSSYLIISDIVICTHALNLHGTQHPANVVDDLNVVGRCLHNSVSPSVDESEILTTSPTFLSCNNFVACIRCSNCNVPSGIS